MLVVTVLLVCLELLFLHLLLYCVDFSGARLPTASFENLTDSSGARGCFYSGLIWRFRLIILLHAPPHLATPAHHMAPKLFWNCTPQGFVLRQAIEEF